MHVIYCLDYNLTWLEDVKHSSYRFVWEAQEKISTFGSYGPPHFSRHVPSWGDLSQPRLLPPLRQCWLCTCWFIPVKQKLLSPLPTLDLCPALPILVNDTAIYIVTPGSHHPHMQRLAILCRFFLLNPAVTCPLSPSPNASVQAFIPFQMVAAISWTRCFPSLLENLGCLLII